MTSFKVEQKRKKARQNILRGAIPFIKSGEYSDLTIRELCKKLDITTGMFYQYFSSKDDILSFYSLELCNDLYEKSSDEIAHMPLREQLLRICLINVRSCLAIGPDGIIVYLNTSNPDCNCEAGRRMFREYVREAFDNACTPSEYTEDQITRTAEYLLILLKGISFEYYSRRDDPDFDMMKISEDMLRIMIGAIDLPDQQ